MEKKDRATKDRRVHDMTRGEPRRLIFRFMLPLMGGNFLQQLYTVVDAIIVGQGVGVDALAAVGATDWIYWFMLWAAAGFGQGFSVIVSQAFGEKNQEKLTKSINMSVILCIVVGIALATIGMAAAKPMLMLLNTPDKIIEMAHTYVMIMYAGIFVITVYHAVSCILRALGDSKTPFIALLISTVINILLDLLFVIVFKWGVAGAAIASVMAQAFAGVYCIGTFLKLSVVSRRREDWRPDKIMILSLWWKGFATAFQYSIIAIGGIVVQYALNTLGFIYVAGFTAANKLYGVLEAISLAMGSAMMVYAGQNYGARNKERIKKGSKASLIFGCIISAVIFAIIAPFGRSILKMFVDMDSNVADQVLQIGYKYLFIMCTMLIFLYLINTYRYIIMSLNRMVIVVFASSLELVTRVVMAMMTLYAIGAEGVFFIEVTSWILGGIFLFAAYNVIVNKLDFEEK